MAANCNLTRATDIKMNINKFLRIHSAAPSFVYLHILMSDFYFGMINISTTEFNMASSQVYVLLTLANSEAVRCLDLTPLIEISGSVMAETRTGIVCSGTASFLPSHLK